VWEQLKQIKIAFKRILNPGNASYRSVNMAAVGREPPFREDFSTGAEE
jgi:hypothetical protein